MNSDYKQGAETSRRRLSDFQQFEINGHPDHGSCDAADFTYIKQGHYGKVDMGGFKAVVIGDLIDHDASKVQGTVYFDKSSTQAQRDWEH